MLNDTANIYKIQPDAMSVEKVSSQVSDWLGESESNFFNQSNNAALKCNQIQQKILQINQLPNERVRFTSLSSTNQNISKKVHQHWPQRRTSKLINDHWNCPDWHGWHKKQKYDEERPGSKYSKEVLDDNKNEFAAAIYIIPNNYTTALHTPI